jgi:hypothetical protein
MTALPRIGLMLGDVTGIGLRSLWNFWPREKPMILSAQVRQILVPLSTPSPWRQNSLPNVFKKIPEPVRYEYRPGSGILYY